MTSQKMDYTHYSPKNCSIKQILPWGLLVLALSTLPYLVAWLQAPSDKLFLGALINSEDLATYISAMRQGMLGDWLYHFTFTPEPWQPKLMNISYMLVGKVAGLVGGDLLLWYHIFRLTSAGFVLLMILFWVRALFPGAARLQLTGWFIIIFGGGLGWLFSILGIYPNSPDLMGPEWSVFMGIFHTPHYALGLGLEIALFACVVHVIRNPSDWKWSIGGAVISLFSGLTYVYHLPIIGLVVGFSVLGTMWQKRKILWQLIAAAAIVLFPSTLLLIYYSVFAMRDPYFSHYSRSVLFIKAPEPLAVLIGLGFLAVLALFALPSWFKDDRSWVVPIWAITNIILIYIPVTRYMGRFVLGLIIPIATLAAYGLERVVLPYLETQSFYTKFSRMTPTPYASLRRVFIFLVIPSTIIIPFWMARDVIQHTDFPTYVWQSEVEAVHWIGEHTQETDLILGAYPMSNYIPRESASKVFSGYVFFTTDFEGKQALINQFWQADTSAAWRQDLIDTWDITYVYEGVVEKELGEGSVPIPGDVVYENDTVIIYQINSENE